MSAEGYPEPDGNGVTPGWSGSDASHERAQHEERSGTAARRRGLALDRLAYVGERGVTWREVAEWYGWHHGEATSVLSHLHREGHVARLLNERRGRCSVYVLPQHAGDRPTAPHGRGRPVPAPGLPADVGDYVVPGGMVRSAEEWHALAPDGAVSLANATAWVYVTPEERAAVAPLLVELAARVKRRRTRAWDRRLVE